MALQEVVLHQCEEQQQGSKAAGNEGNKFGNARQHWRRELRNVPLGGSMARIQPAYWEFF